MATCILEALAVSSDLPKPFSNIAEPWYPSTPRSPNDKSFIYSFRISDLYYKSRVIVHRGSVKKQTRAILFLLLKKN